MNLISIKVIITILTKENKEEAINLDFDAKKFANIAMMLVQYSSINNNLIKI